jgi:uncharacterized membrane protein YkoI
MKNLLFLIMAMAFLNLVACGQKTKDLPEKVKSAFAEKFPNASKVKWEKENDKEWEAEFKMNGKEYTANFDLEGNWMETEYEISIDDLPEAVKSCLAKEFADYKIKEAEVAETSDGKVYEFELKKGSDVAEAVISINGKVLSKEPEKEEDDDED